MTSKRDQRIREWEAQKAARDEEDDVELDDLSEKEILMAIFEETAAIHRRVQTISLAAGLWLAMVVVGAVLYFVAVATL